MGLKSAITRGVDPARLGSAAASHGATQKTGNALPGTGQQGRPAEGYGNQRRSSKTGAGWSKPWPCRRKRRKHSAWVWATRTACEKLRQPGGDPARLGSAAASRGAAQETGSVATQRAPSGLCASARTESPGKPPLVFALVYVCQWRSLSSRPSPSPSVPTQRAPSGLRASAWTESPGKPPLVLASE